MANITPAVIVMSDVFLTIGTDNYEYSVSKVQMDPTVAVTTWKGLSPTAIYPIAGTPSWMVTIEYAQDSSTTNSLTQYLLANNGTQQTLVFKPKKTGTTGTIPTWTIPAIIVAGPIGGAIDTAATGSVQMPGVGQPVRTLT